MTFPHIQNGYEYEFLEMVNLMDENKTEPHTIPHSETLRNMYIVDNARKSRRYSVCRLNKNQKIGKQFLKYEQC